MAVILCVLIVTRVAHSGGMFGVPQKVFVWQDAPRWKAGRVVFLIFSAASESRRKYELFFQTKRIGRFFDLLGGYG